LLSVASAAGLAVSCWTAAQPWCSPPRLSLSASRDRPWTSILRKLRFAG